MINPTYADNLKICNDALMGNISPTLKKYWQGRKVGFPNRKVQIAHRAYIQQRMVDMGGK